MYKSEIHSGQLRIQLVFKRVLYIKIECLGIHKTHILNEVFPYNSNKTVNSMKWEKSHSQQWEGKIVFEDFWEKLLNIIMR